MAPKRKLYKPRVVGGTSPFVVILLVIMFIFTLGLAGACYFGYAGQADLKKEAENAKNREKVEHKAREFAEYVMREWRDAVGNPLLKDELDEANALNVGREDLFKGNKFNDQKFKAVVEKGIEDNRKILGWNDKTKTYDTNYKKKVEDLQAEVAKLRGENSEMKKQVADKDKLYTDLFTKFDDQYKDLGKKVAEGNKEALDKVKEKIKQVEEYSDKVAQLNKEIGEKQLDHLTKMRDKDKLISELYAELETVKKKALLSKGKSGDGGPPTSGKGQPQQQYAGRFHALILDVSKGHPLWDDPKGKILKVDLGKREVVINLGFADGVQKELTFNIFASGWKGEAAGPLKGTIEVKAVLTADTSVARITSLFDSTGKEVPIFDPLKGAGQRAADNPIREGDLLFNVLWKSRVALAGRFNFADYDTPSPAEDLRQLKLFINLLKKQGMIVDAYLDPTTAKVVGEITPRTHFLILGEPITSEALATGVGPNATLQKEFNAQIGKMRNQAAEDGLFLISSYNFAFVTGYRPPQSADSSAISSFIATTPDAGGGTGVKKGKQPDPKQPEKSMPK